ncbi:hypothetical protein [Rahnella aceris]
MPIKELLEIFENKGYLFIPEFLSQIDTLNIAKMIGKIYEFDGSVYNTSISTLQTLSSKTHSESSLNSYSGIFGLNEFPFHTDLAHWAIPPRYILLRCLKGYINTYTHVLTSDEIKIGHGMNNLKKCILIQRKRDSNGRVFPLPLIFNNEFIRWDSVFLKPVNASSEDFYLWMHERKWAGLEHSFRLVNKGDTLLIDNWKVMHSRSSVEPSDEKRIIERVYLSEINL